MLCRRGTKPGRQSFYVQHFVAALTQLPKSARKVSGEPFEYIPAIVLGPVGVWGSDAPASTRWAAAKPSTAGRVPAKSLHLGSQALSSGKRQLIMCGRKSICGLSSVSSKHIRRPQWSLQSPQRRGIQDICAPLASPGTLLSLEQVFYVYIYTAPTTALRENLHQ